MLCENAAQSNDYFEFIGEYSGVLDYVKEEFNTECITAVSYPPLYRLYAEDIKFYGQWSVWIY